MTPTELKMLKDTINNVHDLAKGVLLMKKSLEEAETQIALLQTEMLGNNLKAKSNEKAH